MPGVAVGGQGDGGPPVEEPAGGGVGRPQAERRGRQQDGHHPGEGQRPGVVLGGVDEVVGAGAAQLGGQEGAAGVGQLFGVQAGDETVGLAGLEGLAGLGHRQGAQVAEGVAALGQRGAGRQHLFHQQVEVARLREEVGAEECRVDPQRRPLRHRGDHLEQPHLGPGVEAVARLGLQRRGPRRQGRPRPRLGLFDQRLGAGRPGGGHRGHDPAGLVAVTPQAGLVLGGPVAGKGQMGMGVDEPRQHAPSAGVELLEVVHPTRQAPFRPDPRHLPALDEHGAPLDHPQVERPFPFAGHDLRRPPHQELPRRAHCTVLSWPGDTPGPPGPSSMGIRTPRSRATAAASA